MVKRLPQFRLLTSLLAGAAVVVAIVFGAVVEQQLAFGQAIQPPRITSITTTSVTANSARVDATFSEAVESRLVYGTTTQYGQSVPAGTYFPAATSQAFSLTNLTPGTTYHYKVEIRRDATSPAVGSADRTFTTRSGSVGGSQLVITSIVADCVDTQCRVSFTTSVAANVQLRWDNNAGGVFNDYTLGAVGEAAGTYLAINRGLLAGGLNPSSTYHYRLYAVDPDTNDFLTNDLTFITSSNPDDHTFTTGGCSDGTAIGQCSVATPGAYCEAGGNLVRRCGSSCGYTCPAGQTCNSTQQCVIDPTLSGSPFQCNISDCYELSGAFKAQAPAGCYATWPKCSANKILKVRKDRGCNLWLTCGTSVQLEPKAGERAENLCLSLAACNSLSQQGQCNRYLPLGQCDNDPLRFCSTDTDCQAGGTCNNPDPQAPTRSLQNITYRSPDDIERIADLSGNVVAGLDWYRQGGASVIQGLLPWQMMRQVGGNAEIDNPDFESSATDPRPWEIVPFGIPREYQSVTRVTFEDQSASHNRVLSLNPRTQVQNTLGAGTCSDDPSQLCTIDGDCREPGDTTSTCSLTNGTCSNNSSISCNRTNAAARCSGNACNYPDATVNFAGVASEPFITVAPEYYYGEVRVRVTKGSPHLRIQFGHGDYTRFTVADGPDADTLADPAYVDITATSAWQRVGIGPITGMAGSTRLAVVCADPTSCVGSEIQIDDAQVKPVLQINTNPQYLAPSCRLYPKEDSPACEYVDQTGIKYKGWRGYCLETDSVTGTCLSWWPVDILKGESGVFGLDKPAGYTDQNPLYLCAESEGNYNRPDPLTGQIRFLDGFQGDWAWDDSNCSSGCRSPYYDKPITNVQVMATRVWRIQTDVTKACGDDVENACGGSSIRGICICDHHDFTLNIAAVAQDQTINKSDIYYFKTAKQRWDTRFDGMPELVLYEGNNWTAEWNGGNSNYTRIQLNWNADGFLSSYTVALGPGNSDNDNDATGYWVAGMFFMREQCNKLVQVVKPGGQNVAWASRVNDLAYTIPDLGYGRTKDLLPYGGALPPADVGDVPNGWPSSLDAETQNTTEFAVPGQSRAGSPYACDANCSKYVCNLDVLNDCSTTALIDKCQNNTDVGSQIINSDINGDGVGDGQCIGVNSTAASSRSLQEFSTTLDPASDPIGAPGCFVQQRACATSSSISRSYPSTTSDATAIADLNARCAGAIACNGTTGSCPGQGTTVNFTGVRDASCRPWFIGKRCSGTCYITAGTNYSKAQFGADTRYYAQQHMRRVFGESYGVWQLQSNRYIQISDESSTFRWLPPNEICSKGDNARPARPGYPNDYCAVPPGVVDDETSDQDGPQFLTGNARQATVTGGSGSIGIKFNTTGNPDQFPLKHIKIDWGDTTDTFAYPFAPREDTSKPHIFSHIYVINPANPNCRLENSRTVCTYPIKIQVEDNWGWCNDAKKNGSATLQDLTPDSQCDANHANWYNTGLTVRVEP